MADPTQPEQQKFDPTWPGSKTFDRAPLLNKTDSLKAFLHFKSSYILQSVFKILEALKLSNMVRLNWLVSKFEFSKQLSVD